MGEPSCAAEADERFDVAVVEVRDVVANASAIDGVARQRASLLHLVADRSVVRSGDLLLSSVRAMHERRDCAVVLLVDFSEVCSLLSGRAASTSAALEGAMLLGQLHCCVF